MPPPNTNIAAFNLTISTLLRNPSLLLPTLTIPTFLQLPEDELGRHLLHQPASSLSPSPASSSRYPTIRALVIDKDNTLAPPHTTTLPPQYKQKLTALRTNPASPFNLSTNPGGILIVSNTAGSNPNSQRYEAEADKLEEDLHDLKIRVFRSHRRKDSASLGGRGSVIKKPFSHRAVLDYLIEQGVVKGPDEVAIVGDRIGTDVLMAGLMGSWSVWVREGVRHDLSGEQGRDYRGVLAKAERHLERYLRRRGVGPSIPTGWERAGQNL
ncbi:hypothetical protein FQN57_006028 [Myotisia sp. PD_48]|nr:hypothetical protein FQN57_006028 [Myotisia sp. PD_48]